MDGPEWVLYAGKMEICLKHSVKKGLALMHMQTALPEQTQAIIGQCYLELFMEDRSNVITQTGTDTPISIKKKHWCVKL